MNHSPSLACETAVDAAVKSALVSDALALVCTSARSRQLLARAERKVRPSACGRCRVLLWLLSVKASLSLTLDSELDAFSSRSQEATSRLYGLRPEANATPAAERARRLRVRQEERVQVLARPALLEPLCVPRSWSHCASCVLRRARLGDARSVCALLEAPPRSVLLGVRHAPPPLPPVQSGHVSSIPPY